MSTNTYRYGSLLIANCETSAEGVIVVLLSVINASFALGDALPNLEAFATAVGSASAVFEIVDRVRNLVVAIA